MKIFDFFRNTEPEEVKPVTEEDIVKANSNAYLVLETFTTAYNLRFKKLGRNADSITTDELLKDVTGGDLITTSHMLIDIHEALNIKIDYVPGDEYKEFPTVGDVIDYFIDNFDYEINVLNPHLLD